jgi:hypothetical protein
MKVATEWIRAARNTDTPEPLTNGSPERLELLTGDTSDHRPGLSKNLGDNHSDDERDPLVRSDTFKIVRDDAKTVLASRRVHADTPSVERWPVPRLHLDPLPTAQRARVPDRIKESLQVVGSGPGLRSRTPLRQGMTTLHIALRQTGQMTGGDTNEQVSDATDVQFVQPMGLVRVGDRHISLPESWLTL